MTNRPNPGDPMRMPSSLNSLKGLNAGPETFTNNDLLTQSDMIEQDLGTMVENPGMMADTTNFPDLQNSANIPNTQRQHEIDAEVLAKIHESKAKRIEDAIEQDINSMKSKYNSVPKNPLSFLKELIQKGELTETFELYGAKWKMRALDQNDLMLSLDAIKDTLDTTSGRFTAMTTAQVVYSIEALNDTPIYQFFPEIKLEDFNNDEQEYIYAVKRALKKYLTGLPPKIIDELYAKYLELDEKRNKALDELKNS